MGDKAGKETSVVQKTNGSVSNSQAIPAGQLENGSVRQALENEDVLERIFLWTAFEDLRNCRLVSQLWNRASTKQLESKLAPVTIPANVDTLKKLVSVLDSSWNFPCTKFKLDGATGTYIRAREERWIERGKMERQLCKFFESASAQLKELSIFEWHRWTDQHFQKNLPQNVEYSFLKVFNVHIASVWSPAKDHLNNLKFVANILENAPKLESFSLYRWSSFYKYGEITPILNALESVSQRSLRYLQIDGGLTDEHLIRLTSMALKLKGFKCLLEGLKLGTGSNEVAQVWNLEHSLKGLLESLKDTLMEFELLCDGFPQVENFSLPQMPKLTKLKLTKCWWTDAYGYRPANLSLGIIVYQEQLPVLKCLEFSNLDEAFMENFVQPQPNLATVDTVEELVFGYQLENQTVVLQASRLFTKLRKLEVYWDSAVVKAVFELLDGLEELTLVSKYGYSILEEPISVSIDQLLTGCSEEDLKDMRNWSSEKLRRFVKEPPAFLQSLKVLRLKSSSSFPERSTLTDIGCELVLMRLKSFEKLEVGWQMPPEVSENMLERMKQKFRVCLGSRPQPGRHIVQY